MRSRCSPPPSNEGGGETRKSGHAESKPPAFSGGIKGGGNLRATLTPTPPPDAGGGQARDMRRRSVVGNPHHPRKRGSRPLQRGQVLPPTPLPPSNGGGIRCAFLGGREKSSEGDFGGSLFIQGSCPVHSRGRGRARLLRRSSRLHRRGIPPPRKRRGTRSRGSPPRGGR